MTSTMSLASPWAADVRPSCESESGRPPWHLRHAALLCTALLTANGLWQISRGDLVDDGVSDGFEYLMMADDPQAAFASGAMYRDRAYRFMASALVRVAFLTGGFARTLDNYILAFQLLGLLSIVAAGWLWVRIARRLELGGFSLWLGVLSIPLNCHFAKTAYCHPILPDNLGLLVILGVWEAYLAGARWRTVAFYLFGVPTLSGFSLFALPLALLPRQASAATKVSAALPAASVAALYAAAYGGLSYYVASQQAATNFMMHYFMPQRFGPLTLNCLISAALLYVGLRWLADDRRLFSPRAWLAHVSPLPALFAVAGLAAFLLAMRELPAPTRVTWQSLLSGADTLLLRGTRFPFIIPLALAIYLGPLVVVVAWCWKPTCRALHQLGLGATLAAIAEFLTIFNTEGRHHLVLFVVLTTALLASKALERLPTAAKALLLVSAVHHSRVWLLTGDWRVYFTDPRWSPWRIMYPEMMPSRDLILYGLFALAWGGALLWLRWRSPAAVWSKTIVAAALVPIVWQLPELERWTAPLRLRPKLQLETTAGSAAKVEQTAHRPDRWQAFDLRAANGKPDDVRLVHREVQSPMRLPVVAFRARSTADRPLEVVVTNRRRGPAGGEFRRRVTLNRQWGHYFLEYQEPFRDPIELRFELGASGAPVELADVQLTGRYAVTDWQPALPQVEQTPVHLVADPEDAAANTAGSSHGELLVRGLAQASVERDSERDGEPVVRTSILAAAGPPSEVQLVQTPVDLHKGDTWRIRFDARADSARTIAVGAGPQPPAWRETSFYWRMPVDLEWQTYVLEFVVDVPAEQGRCYLDLAGKPGVVETRRLTFERLDGGAPADAANVEDGSGPAPSWQLRTEGDWQAALRQLPGSRVIRLEVGKQGPTPAWNLQATCTVAPVTAGAHYELRFRARSDAPRSVEAHVAQAHEPWQSLGVSHRVELGPMWRDYRVSFEATAGDDRARVAFDLGESAVAAEWADVTVLPVD